MKSSQETEKHMHPHDHEHHYGHDHSRSGLIPLSSLLEPSPAHKKTIDIQALREKLATGRGPTFWRTLDEAAESEELREYIEEEFPALTGEIPQGIDRRNLLKVMAASLAMAGAAACTKQPKELIVPYVRQPENVIPGIPLFYATAMPAHGYARGLLVESHLNRPTKIEGNPDHPASLGSTTVFEQGSVLNLYDPDRSETVLHTGRLSTWSDFTIAFNTETQNLLARKGEGLAILTGVCTSPTLISQISSLFQQMPAARWYIHEPSVNPAVASAARQIAGRKAFVHYDLSQADVIVSLDSDFLNNGPAALVYARQWSQRRKAIDNGQTPVRHYAIEAGPTVSGSIADHHFPMESNKVSAIAYQLAKACGAAAPDVTEPAPAWLSVIVQDLQASKGRCVIIPGEYQPESVHLAAYAANAALGNVGKTVRLLESVEPDNTHSIEELTGDLNNGRVETLLILGGNPVYTAPSSLNFADAIRKARLVVRLGNFYDETSRYSHWHIPEAHYLETWSDSRAFDGTATIQQPLLQPLYEGKSAHEIVSILQNRPEQNSHAIVKAYWQGQIKDDFDTVWQTSLHNGTVAGTTVGVINAAGRVTIPPFSAPQSGEVEVVLRPDPTIGDGTYSNNGWLQELPKPQTKMTWENPVTVSPGRAAKMNIHTGDILRVTVNGKSVEGPAWIVPGQAEGSVVATFGYGRTGSGRLGNDIGYNAYLLQDAGSRFTVGGTLAKTGKHVDVADGQHTQTMAGREPVRTATYKEFQQHPNFPTMEEKPLAPSDTIYERKDWPYDGYKWGMTIDLNVCTGCSACTIACQAENNIAVVGKDQVAKGRRMHWIRVDRYYSGNMDAPEIYNQPVPCMHCEQAPCEVVCPVGATVHSNEGINQMVYNRCVGTRYCSNNCPYKVRRFNFLLYSDWNTQSLYGVRNPDVTVRSRGVMEKCTYCVQRIQEAKIKTEKEGRFIRDGEVVPACAQVCPTQAIYFGNLNDKNSVVAKTQALPRSYGMLDDLNTRPRTLYLGYVRNSNDALRSERGSEKS
jgi:molybdopterin-containing oxidoreductase family iron-sulfur binding subunit